MLSQDTPSEVYKLLLYFDLQQNELFYYVLLLIITFKDGALSWVSQTSKLLLQQKGASA